MKKEEKYWNILQYNVEWLRYSETKATIILTIYGILFTIIFTNTSNLFTQIESSCFLLTMSIIWSILSVLSMFFAFKCINPILKNPNPKSIIYFGHISTKFENYSDFFEHTKSIISNDDNFSEQVSEQIYVNSKIAWKKFTNVTWSLRFFILNILVTLIEIFIIVLK